MLPYKAKEPKHSVSVNRAVYVSWCNAAQAEGLPLEVWIVRAGADQIAREAKARMDAAYIEHCEEEIVRQPFEQWRIEFERKNKRR